jgi:hypothetical protein
LYDRGSLLIGDAEWPEMWKAVAKWLRARPLGQAKTGTQDMSWLKPPFVLKERTGGGISGLLTP